MFDLRKSGQTLTKIGYIALQSNNHFFLLMALLLLGGALSANAQEDGIIPLPIAAEKDTLMAPLFPGPIDATTTKTDSLKRDSIKSKPSILLDKIKYKPKIT